MVAKDAQKPHHRLTALLSDFRKNFPDTELGRAIGNALPTPGAATPISRFLASNSIEIDNWYEALKYPESNKGQIYSHFELKYGGSDTLQFWRDVHAFSADIHAQAAALSTAEGYE